MQRGEFRSWDISQTLFRWPGRSETSTKRHVDRTRKLDPRDALLRRLATLAQALVIAELPPHVHLRCRTLVVRDVWLCVSDKPLKFERSAPHARQSQRLCVVAVTASSAELWDATLERWRGFNCHTLCRAHLNLIWYPSRIPFKVEGLL
jgi:hypothetical protein